MKFKLCCDKFTGHKSLGIRLDHDEFAIGVDLIWCFIGVARVYPYQALVKTEDLRKDI
jgi:hypothetical protein